MAGGGRAWAFVVKWGRAYRRTSWFVVACFVEVLQDLLCGLLRFLVVCLGGDFFIPGACFVIVPRYALAVFVEDAEVVLGFCMILCSGFFPPCARLGVILRDA